MSDLTTSYLGLSLRSPIIASASPYTGRLDTLIRMQDCGLAAVVLPSLFEEDIEQDELSLHAALEQGREHYAEAMDYFPDLEDYDTGPDRHVRLVEEAKHKLEVPVIASVNGRTPGGWVGYATLLAEAGADAIELNIYDVAAQPTSTAAMVETSYLDIVRQVRAAVDVPLAVKLSPYFSSFANFVGQVVAAGADGLVLFNRFYQPDLDLERLAVQPKVSLSHSVDLRLPLRWIAILRGQLQSTSLAATSGVHTGADVAKALLVGADVACMTSALLRNGVEHAIGVERDLVRWLADNEYESVNQLRGSVSQRGVEDPSAFERSNYLRVLQSYTPGSSA